jgi:hypothetical protein
MHKLLLFKVILIDISDLVVKLLVVPLFISLVCIYIFFLYPFFRLLFKFLFIFIRVSLDSEVYRVDLSILFGLLLLFFAILLLTLFFAFLFSLFFRSSHYITKLTYDPTYCTPHLCHRLPYGEPRSLHRF